MRLEKLSLLVAILVNGKPIPDNRGNISTRLMEHIRDNPAKETYEDEFFSIRYFRREPHILPANAWSWLNV